MNDTHQLGALLERCRTGDPEALNALLGKLRPYLRLLVRSQLGPDLGRQPDASDLVQESLLRIYRGFSQFAGQNVPELLGWVGQIANHVVVSWERHQGAGKRNHRREVCGTRFLAGAFSGDSTPEQRLMRDEEAARLAEAMERLPEAYREVIQARVFDQLSFANVSERTGKSVGALRVLCLRAIQRLRKEMGAAS
jgi:RNA polymerase sigma-70 factor (ECF subfamily)